MLDKREKTPVNLLYKDECYKIIGACMDVHSVLGCGFLEPVYHEALAIEFELQKIPYMKESEITIKYKDITLSRSYKADFICFDRIIVELKALSALTGEHASQVINYLKATGLRVGLLVNFGTSSLQHQRFII